MKICKDCGRELPISEYSVNTKGKLNVRCDDCHREKKAEYQRAYRAKKEGKYAGYDQDAKTRVCVDCGREFPLSKFSVNAQGVWGFDVRCTKCKNLRMTEYKKKYYREHREVMSKQNRVNNHKNKDSCRERAKKYKQEHPEKNRECARKYYWANREKCLEKKKVYNAANPKKIKKNGDLDKVFEKYMKNVWEGDDYKK